MNKKIIIILLPIILIYCCTSKNNEVDKINQQSTLYSPSKKYILNVSVVIDEKNGFVYWWQIEILNIDNDSIFIDNNNFPGRFNVYWNWDNEDRIWFYNSDDGSIYYWELASGKWQETKYTKESTTLVLPNNFLPEYAK